MHGDGKSLAPAIVTGRDNPNCRIIDVGQEKDGLRWRIVFIAIINNNYEGLESLFFCNRLKVELLAYKEKILKDEVQIMCCNAGTPLKIQLNARVLGKDKGTPLLRNGIRSIAVEGSDEDEVSE